MLQKRGVQVLAVTFFDEIPRKKLYGNRSLKKINNFKSLVLASLRSSNKALSTRILGFLVIILSPGSFKNDRESWLQDWQEQFKRRTRLVCMIIRDCRL